MSVRVCYMQRGDRGVALRSLRLVGPGVDDAWPERGQALGVSEDYAGAASWVRARLDASRTASAVSVLCLDVDGGTCAWIQAPSGDPGVVASVARMGGDQGKTGGGAFEFYAPGELESTIQPLTPAGAGPGRVAVLALTDVPARLLIDALDRQRVGVEGVQTLWHALARAWDPGAETARPAGAAISDDPGPVTAVIAIDPAGRLVWCWSRAGSLIAGGSQRLRVARLEGAGGGEAGDEVVYGAEEASRLAAEWLSWSVQVRAAPGRIVCVLTPGEGAGEFGSAMAKLWPGASVDACPDADPLGATLARLAARLEATPKQDVRRVAPETGLVGLTERPGLAHRRMVMWQSLAIVALAGVLGVVSWHLYGAAASARDAQKQIEASWRDVVKGVYPDALVPQPRTSPLQLLDNEITARRRSLKPPERTDQTMPILQELETITMVIGTGDFALESVDLRSGGQGPRVSVIAKTTPDAEELGEAFKRIGGSYIVNWTGKYLPKTEGTEARVAATYSGEWNMAAIKAAGGGK